MDINIEWNDSEMNALLAGLEHRAQKDFSDASAETIDKLYQHLARPGNTPRDSGELIASMNKSGETLGFNAKHAAPVEYGHNLVAWGNSTGRKIQGQFYLRSALDKMGGEFKNELEQTMRE